MTIEEYKRRLHELENEFQKDKSRLAEEYATSNNPYKVGDILKDHYQIIKVEKIDWDYQYPSNEPTCVYYGTQLTTKLVPKKRQDNTPIMLQCNVLYKIRKLTDYV